jgi:DNA-binding transcriptional ArsR family regulator
MDESFLLLSLKENQSKKLAQVMSNETSRQILEYLANKEFATETQISTELKIPLSTVHYNMKALKETGMVVDDEYHYSQKGKEVPHYKLAKRYIIIAPRDDNKFFDKIKRFLPVGAFVGVGTGIVHLAQRFFASQTSKSQALVMSTDSQVAGDTLMIRAVAEDEFLAESAPVVLDSLADNVTSIIPPSYVPIEGAWSSPIALWFLIGGVFALVCVVVWELVRKK